MEKKTNTYKPAKSAVRFLNWFCKTRFLEDIEGDLEEKFRSRIPRVSKLYNQLLYWIDMLGFFRPMFCRKNLFGINIHGVVMFKSNLKFALRNIKRSFFFSFINISGLALGIASVLFIFFYIQNEMSYDSFHEKGDRICRVLVDAKFSGNEFKSAAVGGVVAPTMKKDFPEVEQIVRINKWDVFYVKHKIKSFKEYNIIQADSSFFKIFTIPVLKGDPDKVLSAPNSIVISNSSALKYFDNSDPIGKTLTFDEEDTYTVTGVFKDIPANSHFDADFIVSMVSDNYADQDGWTNGNYYTYILLKENASFTDLENKLPSLMKNYGYPELEKAGFKTQELLASGVYWDFRLQHFNEIHFDTKFGQDLKPSTAINYIYIFAAIAIFILIIASINFINLSTAKSANRAKEVGIKKVVGSLRKELIIQFLTESLVLSFVAFLLAIGLVETFKPLFFEILGKRFEIAYLSNLEFGIAILGILIFTGLVAGTFPAFVLSNFKPVEILKGNMKNAMKKSWLRSTLVVFQFSASLVLIIVTIVVFNQLEFMQNKNLGFDKEQVLIVDDPYILEDQSKVFKQKMIDHPNVLSGTLSGFLPVESYRSRNGFFRDGNRNDPKIRPIERFRIDYDYFKTLGINITSGRNFAKDYATDSSAVVINKACAEYFEFDNPLTHEVSRFISNTELKNFPIIGVVEDFHINSLKSKMEPIIFVLDDHNGYAAFKIRNNIPDVIKYAEKCWNELAPGQPFSYQFMDDAFNKVYKSEERILELFRSFAFLAVIIGCLGLLGLSAFSAEKRTKEIGIRKIHGATVSSIIFQLSKEFTVLVGVAIIISSPIAYWLVDKWLQGYANRIDLSAATFFLAGVLAMAIAILTVSFHAIKASLMNPAKALRYE